MIRYTAALLAATTVVLVLFACAGPSSRVPAPVDTPRQPVSEPVVKAYPMDQAPEFVGEQLELQPPPGAEPAGLLGTDREGGQVLLSDYRGKVLVVSYWASWCPPCWTEMPQLEQIRSEYRDRGVAIVAVNKGETQSTIDVFLQRQNPPLQFTVVADPDGEASLARGVRAVPATLLYDDQGSVARRYLEQFGFDPEQIRADINRVLEKN